MPLLLLPPSEWKRSWWAEWPIQLTIQFETYPEDILFGATQNDLKCTWKRFEAAVAANRAYRTAPVLPARQRYTWVLYKALDFTSLPQTAQEYAMKKCFVLSWLFGLVSLADTIPDYKLPISVKGLRQFWKPVLTQAIFTRLNEYNEGTIVSLLSWPYSACIDWKFLKKAGIDIDIPTPNDWKNHTHMIKKRRWFWLHDTLLSTWL